jgi:hypothetical protein
LVIDEKSKNFLCRSKQTIEAASLLFRAPGKYAHKYRGFSVLKSGDE